MKGNLLIVDDEPILLDTLKYNLEGFADKIFTALNGIEALEVLNQHEIHCIVCDINMPLMNGVQVLKKMRENKINIPFIFYTGHGNKDLMLEAAKYGALDFLDKPALDGLEEVVMRGLEMGTNKSVKTAQVGSFLSEYTKLLEEIEKRNNS
jgi:DNA-binding NtrC family response regulator